MSTSTNQTKPQNRVLFKCSKTQDRVVLYKDEKYLIKNTEIGISIYAWDFIFSFDENEMQKQRVWLPIPRILMQNDSFCSAILDLT